MPGPVIAAGLLLLVALAIAAWSVPAPQVSDDAWTAARIGLVPVGLLWLVSLTFFSRPAAFAFAMTSGAGFWACGCCARRPRRARGGGTATIPAEAAAGADRGTTTARPDRRRATTARRGTGTCSSAWPMTRGATRRRPRGRAGCQTERSHGFRELLRRPRRARGGRAHLRLLPARGAPAALRRRAPALLPQGPARERVAQRGRRRRAQGGRRGARHVGRQGVPLEGDRLHPGARDP